MKTGLTFLFGAIGLVTFAVNSALAIGPATTSSYRCDFSLTDSTITAKKSLYRNQMKETGLSGATFTQVPLNKQVGAITFLGKKATVEETKATALEECRKLLPIVIEKACNPPIDQFLSNPPPSKIWGVLSMTGPNLSGSLVDPRTHIYYVRLKKGVNDIDCGAIQGAYDAVADLYFNSETVH